MDADRLGQTQIPSWQSEPCPPWCSREHREDDHPEDRLHQDDGVSFPAVVARIDRHDLRRVPVASEIVVQRSQSVFGDRAVWVIVGEAEAANRLTLSADFAPALLANLS